MYGIILSYIYLDILLWEDYITFNKYIYISFFLYIMFWYSFDSLEHASQELISSGELL